MASSHFVIDRNTDVVNSSGFGSVDVAIRAFRNDIFRSCRSASGATGAIEIGVDASLGFLAAFRIEVSPDRMVIHGADELGAIHGLYHVSEQHLKIDPFIYFTQILPEPADCRRVPVGTISSPDYGFEHRGFFFNDEDLLVGFQLESHRRGMNPDLWHHLFETALRLNCTCVIPGTNIFSDEPQIRWADEMGLWIAQHHAEPVGSVPAYWSKQIPYRWSTHKHAFVEFWRKAIERQAGRKVLWTLNLRGHLDRAFWEDDPELADASLDEKAAVINEAIRIQYDLIRDLRESDPTTVGYLWGELGELYHRGLIAFPEGTIVMIPDNGMGAVTEHPDVKGARGGVYLHVSMCHRTAHLRTNHVHPDTIEASVNRTIQAGFDGLFLLNVGNFREKIFGIDQVMRLLNAPADHGTPVYGDDFFSFYVENRFGSANLHLADSYRDLLEITPPLNPDAPDSRPGDQLLGTVMFSTFRGLYHHQTDELPKHFDWVFRMAQFPPEETPRSLRDALAWLLDHTDTFTDKWDAAYERVRNALPANLNDRQLHFCRAELVTQIHRQQLHALILSDFCKCVLAYVDARYVEAVDLACQVLLKLDRLIECEDASEGERFKGWYKNDKILKVRTLRQFMARFHAMLRDARYLSLPRDATNAKYVWGEYKLDPGFDSAYSNETPTLNELG